MFAKFISWIASLFAKPQIQKPQDTVKQPEVAPPVPPDVKKGPINQPGGTIVIPAKPVYVDPPEHLVENSKGSVKLGIIVGHEKTSPGAVMAKPYSVTEYFFNSGIATRIQEHVKALYPMISTEVIFRDGIGIAGAYKQAEKLLCDCVIELHFNAFNGTASGSEVLCSSDVNDADFAHEILGQICTCFNRIGSSRGVKVISKADRGGGNVHAFPGGRNCLVEPFFGDNVKEAEMAMKLQDEYALSLLKGVALWARKIDMLR